MDYGANIGDSVIIDGIKGIKCFDLIKYLKKAEEIAYSEKVDPRKLNDRVYLNNSEIETFQVPNINTIMVENSELGYWTQRNVTKVYIDNSYVDFLQLGGRDTPGDFFFYNNSDFRIAQMTGYEFKEGTIIGCDIDDLCFDWCYLHDLILRNIHVKELEVTGAKVKKFDIQNLSIDKLVLNPDEHVQSSFVEKLIDCAKEVSYTSENGYHPEVCFKDKSDYP